MAITIPSRGWANDFNGYFAAAGDTSFTSKTGAIDSPHDNPFEQFMGDPSAAGSFDGKGCYFRSWDVGLTVDELWQEMYSIRPQKWANLIAWLPFWSNPATEKDLTQTGDFAKTGTVNSFADAPPIGWGASPMGILSPAGAAIQTLRPLADVSDGTWKDSSGGTNLYAQIDEAVASDADFIWSPGDNDICQVTLGPAGDPESSTGHTVYFRFQRRGAGTRNIKVSLYQGASTLIATKTVTSIGDSWTNDSFTLSAGEANNITDYSDLRLRFEAIIP
jgi:hypothetical protein